MIKQIQISVTGYSSDKSDQRKSTLQITEYGEIEVIGVLPHGYRFKPTTVKDAWKLSAYLKNFSMGKYLK